MDFGKLGPIGFSKKSGNKKKRKKSGNKTTIVSFSSKGGETEIFKKDDIGLLKTFIHKFRKALGPDRESLIAQKKEERGETRQRLRGEKKLSSEREKAAQDVQKLRTEIDRTDSSLENETELRRLQQLRKNLKTDFDNAKKEVAALEKQAKNIDKEQTTVNKLK